MFLEGVDSPPLQVLYQVPVNNGGTAAWNDVNLAGRASMPASARAVYLQVIDCNQNNNNSFYFTSIRTKGSASVRSYMVSWFFCSTSHIWLALDASQMISIAVLNRPGYVATSASLTLQVLGWTIPTN